MEAGWKENWGTSVGGEHSSPLLRDKNWNLIDTGPDSVVEWKVTEDAVDKT